VRSVPPQCDIAVIGAGPAGALAAVAAAQSGASVLLIDRAIFPRDKVCGGCVNAAALETLRRAGLGDLVNRCAARPLDAVAITAAGRTARLALPAGAAVARSAFDAALARHAVHAGARFIDGAAARVGGLVDDRREVTLTESHSRARRCHAVVARLVIVADGLAGRSLDDHPQYAPRIGPASRIGVAALVPAPRSTCHDGAVHMTVGRRGYVGVVGVEGDRLDIAAAFDPAALRRFDSVAHAVAELWRSNAIDPPCDLEDVRWWGCPPVTRRRPRIAGPRLLIVGDAARYVEPFTGEGIAWALACGEAAARLAVEALHDRAWSPDIERRWAAIHRRLLRARHLRCAAVAALVRRPALARWVVAALRLAPALAGPIVRHINRPTPVTTTAAR